MTANAANKIRLKDVKSKMLSAVGYDVERKEMHIKFPSGKIYVYQDVHADFHDEFMQSKSLGSFFGQSIRGKFKHRIEPDKSDKKG